MPDVPEKPKRKQKPRNWRIGVYLALLGLCLLVMLWLTLPRSPQPLSFDGQLTRIDVTPESLVTLIQLTNISGTRVKIATIQADIAATQTSIVVTQTSLAATQTGSAP